MAESPEFQAYMEAQVVETPEGTWIIEGDIETDRFELVLWYYQRTAIPVDQAEGDDGVSEFRSTSYCGIFGGDSDVIWNPARKLAITYCFDTSWDDVPELLAMAEEQLKLAALAWESAADVNFVQLPGGVECSYETGAVYEITHVPSENGPGELGRASFPNDNEHRLRLWTRAFDDDGAPLQTTLIHELGHMLGLFHERARFPLQDPLDLYCSLPSVLTDTWRGLTAPDSDSVMGYPQCAGTEPMPPYPSALDRAGVGFLYNLSRPVLSGPMGLDSGTLAWHRPSTSDYVIWEPVGGGNQPLSFTETTGCYEPGCELMVDSEYWKPLLYRNDGSVDVLMYGPRNHEERRITELNGVAASDDPGTIFTNNDVPLVLDRLFGENDKSVWWIRPGMPTDNLWRNLDGAAQSVPGFDAPPLTDEHFSPVVGRLFADRSSVVWLSPTSPWAYLTYMQNEAILHSAIMKANCGLGDGIRYNGVPGDYDGDGLDEILWYDFDTGGAIYWPQLLACMNWAEIEVGQAKLAAFRTTGAKDDLMAYYPQHGRVQFIDVASGMLRATVPQPIDASPILRDFDGDGCTDILWFAPHQAMSQLWHSNCDTTFRTTAVQHPTDAYPLGYGLGHGRR